MSKLCTCNEEPNECPVLGHPGKTDRSIGSLVLQLAEQLGEVMHDIREMPKPVTTPVFFQDVRTGKIFQIDAVVRETGDVGDTIFLKGEEY